MGRLKRAAAILEAAEQWKQRCLFDGGSLFTDERLWTRENFEQLRIHFVEKLDEGAGSFDEKLRGQLDPAPAEAKRLCAEIFWVLHLPVISSSVKPATKINRIRRVWEWSGAEFPGEHWALQYDGLNGVLNPGPGYNLHLWRECRFIVSEMADWFSLSMEKRQSLLKNPWDFAEWLYERQDALRRQFPHALLFLLFPDSFESIVVLSHKKKIVKAFFEKWNKTPPDDAVSDPQLHCRSRDTASARRHGRYRELAVAVRRLQLAEGHALDGRSARDCTGAGGCLRKRKRRK